MTSHERHDVSNHQQSGCLFNHFFGHKAALLTFCEGIHPWPMYSPHKGPVTQKCHDVIKLISCSSFNHRYLVPFFKYIKWTSWRAVVCMGCILPNGSMHSICTPILQGCFSGDEVRRAPTTGMLCWENCRNSVTTVTVVTQLRQFSQHKIPVYKDFARCHILQGCYTGDEAIPRQEFYAGKTVVTEVRQ